MHARERVMEHDLIAVPVHRPQPPGAHLALRLAPGLDRRLVHRQHPAVEHMRALRRGDRRQQVDGPARPSNQRRAAELDAAVAKALMLAVQRQVVREFVDQHSRKEAHIAH